MPTTFLDIALEQYDDWDGKDPKTKKRIKALIKDILRNGPAQGIGKPELLKGCGAWSRRIDEKNRLVYTQDENGALVILACKGHYED
ncbi:MAG: Txe/YoeB family addiction module toxin [Oscillospiraceae bacterium]|jgi:toxin YoeB|nr:Txe/YoeB family addiction module toxin [Oscillospiraceae bacterium]